jgi:integrase
MPRSKRSRISARKPSSSAGLPPIRFHDLRHSCLSLLAFAGHTTTAFTLQRYTHHYDASARRTADAMGDIVPDEP